MEVLGASLLVTADISLVTEELALFKLELFARAREVLRELRASNWLEGLATVPRKSLSEPRLSSIIIASSANVD
jgi:hypothetical protein